MSKSLDAWRALSEEERAKVLARAGGQDKPGRRPQTIPRKAEPRPVPISRGQREWRARVDARMRP